MSYILEVLKQSERQRRGTDPQPRLDTPPLVPSQKPASNKSWPWALAGLALTAMVWLWLQSPTQPLQPSATPLPAQKTPEPKAQTPPQVLPPSPPKASSTKLALDPSTMAPVTLDPAPKAVEKTEVTQAQLPRQLTQSETQPMAEEPQMAPESVQPSLPSWRQLPVEVQRQLPALVISVHIYAPQPAQRLVKINDKLYREGADLGGGLTLEAITPQGLQLAYQEWHFTMPAR